MLIHSGNVQVKWKVIAELVPSVPSPKWSPLELVDYNIDLDSDTIAIASFF